MTTAFERNLASRRGADGHHHFEFDDAFRGVAGQFGGLALAASLRAAADELADPALRTRSASAVFVSPIPIGPVEARVDVLRRGRSVAHVTVALHADDDKPLLRTVAVFGRTRPGFAFTDRRRPEVPPPEACQSFLDPPTAQEELPPRPPWTATPFWGSVDRRVADGHHWWERGWSGGSSHGALWLRLRETPPADADAMRRLVALAFTDMGGQSIAEYMGPDAPTWGMVSTDHTAHVLAAPKSEWLLLSFRANRAADGFVSVATELWDQTGELVALGTQIVLLLMD